MDKRGWSDLLQSVDPLAVAAAMVALVMIVLLFAVWREKKTGRTGTKSVRGPLFQRVNQLLRRARRYLSGIQILAGSWLIQRGMSKLQAEAKKRMKDSAGRGSDEDPIDDFLTRYFEDNGIR